jgi:hypothetical protein
VLPLLSRLLPWRTGVVDRTWPELLGAAGAALRGALAPELLDPLLPELPRGTAWPVLWPPLVRRCGAASRKAARDPPNPDDGIETDTLDGLDMPTDPELPAEVATPADAERAPLAPPPPPLVPARATATGRSAAGLPPSPGFCAKAGAAVNAAAATVRPTRKVRDFMCAPPREAERPSEQFCNTIATKDRRIY